MEHQKMNQGLDKLISDLTERAKEFNCLFEVQKLINDESNSFEDVCYGVIERVPGGMQFPEVCKVQLIYGTKIYQSEEFSDTQWLLDADIKVQEKVVGKINVFYIEERPLVDEGPFLEQERSFIDTIANQFGMFTLHHQLRTVFDTKEVLDAKPKCEWCKILDLLKKTDPALTIGITRKMINFLCLRGVKDAIVLFSKFSDNEEVSKEVNSPFPLLEASEKNFSTSEIFALAEAHLSEDEILNNLKAWINEENSGFMVTIFENTGSTLDDLTKAIERYYYLANQGLVLSELREKGFRVALIRRLFTDQASLIDIAKRYIQIVNFHELIQTIISPPGSNGKLGGKSAGLFIAKKILQNATDDHQFLGAIKTPKTWYITSDGMLFFIKHNNLQDTYEQKYKNIGILRQEYPHLVRFFKKSPMPPEMIHQLSKALDDFGKVPLIVRSSSLLEDRMGMAFAGKYKSLFIANQGSKEKRLMALVDAIAEIYASTFGPDPIEYRVERQMIDYHEEMGIMIQEVIGQRVGDYFFPAFAGVAFSTNEFRWSSRLKRKDGLIRMVPGLGTRAVDRVNDDYPILVAPGQPNLRVNVTVDEITRYSPKKIDLINLKTRRFETHDVQDIIRECGQDFPRVNQIVSIFKENFLQIPRPFGVDYKDEEFVVSFDGLISKTGFVGEIRTILNVLEEAYNTPVDIEFAHDGEHIYLLQCRPQSHGPELEPVSLPSRVPDENILFSANKYISNGLVNNLTHIVFVDPEKYSQLETRQEMLAVGRAVGRINKILPKHQFILMGPGRWGSKGDIKLGVSVTYSDINNTAMLIEIAKKKKNYLPDVSFGTHFFLDLVEAGIRYLPLYPDDDGVIFNQKFFDQNINIFSQLVPDLDSLESVVKVIDLSMCSEGSFLEVYMNSEAKKALAVFSDEAPAFIEDHVRFAGKSVESNFNKKKDMHWQWRMQTVQYLASILDAEYYGIQKFYVFGSTKNATAKADSDINIIVHFRGSQKQKEELVVWLDGWNRCLGYINYRKTGVRTEGLLDVHLITDNDITRKSSIALKIDAVTDAARPLAMGAKLKKAKALKLK